MFHTKWILSSSCTTVAVASGLHDALKAAGSLKSLPAPQLKSNSDKNTNTNYP
jgi:hypothetical protein